MHKRLKRVERRLPPEPAPAVLGVLDYRGARIELRARTKQERFRLRAAEKEPWTVGWNEVQRRKRSNCAGVREPPSGGGG